VAGEADLVVVVTQQLLNGPPAAGRGEQRADGVAVGLAVMSDVTKSEQTSDVPTWKSPAAANATTSDHHCTGQEEGQALHGVTPVVDVTVETTCGGRVTGHCNLKRRMSPPRTMQLFRWPSANPHQPQQLPTRFRRRRTCPCRAGQPRLGNNIAPGPSPPPKDPNNFPAGSKT